MEVEVANRYGSIDFSTPVPKLIAYPSARGITVDSVFMPCLNLDRFPNWLEDERLDKWLFVAITRATKWIYFSATDSDNILFRTCFEKLQQDGNLTIQRQAKESSKPSKPIQVEDENDLTDLF